MKFSISFLSIFVLSFILIYSCSTEEEESVAPVVQTPKPEPEPDPVQYSLTVSAADGGTVSTEGGTYEEGTEVTITATANEGYRFTGWEGNSSTSESLTITLNSNQTYQALFELIPIYTLTVTTSEGGIVSTEGGEYQNGTEIELIASPNEGYRFDGWIGSCLSFCENPEAQIVSYNNTITFEIDNNVELYAKFLPIDAPNLISNSGYEFYYNFSEGMPLDWVNYFKNFMIYLNQLIDVKPRDNNLENKIGEKIYVYSWLTSEGLVFENEIGAISCLCLTGWLDKKLMVLNIDDDEAENVGFAPNFHGYSVILHEFFHIYQNNESNIEIPYVKYLLEGGAATLESLWIQQTFGYNYFYDQNQHNAQMAIESPELYETWTDAEDRNYSNSVFIFLALVKEIQLRNNIDEISAFKKVYVDWWSYEGEELTKEEQFELIFGFSMESFYASLSNYSPEIQSVLPSETITLEEIFEDL